MWAELQQTLNQLEHIQFVIGRTHWSLLGLLTSSLHGLLIVLAAFWVSSLLEKRILRQTFGDQSMRRAAANVVRAGLLLLGFLLGLSAVGIDMTALSVLGGAIGVGLGFGLQKLAANYISGFVILFERSLRIGDLVKVDGFEGVVSDITARYTLLRALDGRESVVPNEIIITHRIENSSLADSRVSLAVPVWVDASANVPQVLALLCEAAQASDKVLQDPAPAAFLRGVLPEGLEFVLTVWIADPSSGQLGVRSAINQAIVAGFKVAGVEMARPRPYP